MASVEIALNYQGSDADEHELDFYDAAVALLGFQRSLAITSHLIINGEVITQAPALKGAQIRAQAPKAGSWELPALVMIAAGAIYKVGTAPKDTVIGHMVRSAYDYVVSSVMGFHVDFDSTIAVQFEEARANGGELPSLRPSQLESAAEKCEAAVRDMHRPIVFSETAQKAELISGRGSRARPFGPEFNRATYAQIVEGIPASRRRYFAGKVSSYNMNTFKGRIFLEETGRPVPFEIDQTFRTPENIRVITRSLAMNASRRGNDRARISVLARPKETRTGRLGGIVVESAEEYED